MKSTITILVLIFCCQLLSAQEFALSTATASSNAHKLFSEKYSQVITTKTANSSIPFSILGGIVSSQNGAHLTATTFGHHNLAGIKGTARWIHISSFTNLTTANELVTFTEDRKSFEAVRLILKNWSISLGQNAPLQNDLADWILKLTNSEYGIIDPSRRDELTKAVAAISVRSINLNQIQTNQPIAQEKQEPAKTQQNIQKENSYASVDNKPVPDIKSKDEKSSKKNIDNNSSDSKSKKQNNKKSKDESIAPVNYQNSNDLVQNDTPMPEKESKARAKKSEKVDKVKSNDTENDKKEKVEKKPKSKPAKSKDNDCKPISDSVNKATNEKFTVYGGLAYTSGAKSFLTKEDEAIIFGTGFLNDTTLIAFMYYKKTFFNNSKTQPQDLIINKGEKLNVITSNGGITFNCIREDRSQKKVKIGSTYVEIGQIYFANKDQIKKLAESTIQSIIVNFSNASSVEVEVKEKNAIKIKDQLTCFQNKLNN